MTADFYFVNHSFTQSLDAEAVLFVFIILFLLFSRQCGSIKNKNTNRIRRRPGTLWSSGAGRCVNAPTERAAIRPDFLCLLAARKVRNNSRGNLPTKHAK